VNLANSLSDAIDKLTLARLENGRYQELRKTSSVSASEVEASGVRMSGAKRRLDLLKAIAESSLRSTAVESETLRDQLKLAQVRFEQGIIPLADLSDIRVRVARADGRLDVLKRILESATADDANQPKTAPNIPGTPLRPASDDPAPLPDYAPGPRR
jgi:multidrug resistance efflux pump